MGFWLLSASILASSLGPEDLARSAFSQLQSLCPASSTSGCNALNGARFQRLVSASSGTVGNGMDSELVADTSAGYLTIQVAGEAGSLRVKHAHLTSSFINEPIVVDPSRFASFTTIAPPPLAYLAPPPTVTHDRDVTAPAPTHEVPDAEAAKKKMNPLADRLTGSSSVYDNLVFIDSSVSDLTKFIEAQGASATDKLVALFTWPSSTDERSGPEAGAPPPMTPAYNSLDAAEQALQASRE